MRKWFCAVLLSTMFIYISACKKESSCENCGSGNQPPLCNAGQDQLIVLPVDSAVLDGTLSTDPDGKIHKWQWTKVSGPVSSTILSNNASKTPVRNLSLGTYLFELMVTDDKGLSAKDTVRITVAAAPTTNRPPIANAGTDTTILLPSNTAYLNGARSSDPDNNITSYSWTKIAGPGSYALTNGNTAQEAVSNLVQGVYVFELKVTDAGGLFDRDTVQVSVINPPQACTTCKIVFVSNRDGNEEIYSCNADGSNVTRLTNNASKDEEPVWSPDGTRIAFVSERSGDPQIYIMNADGSNIVQKTFSGAFTQHPTWSPDGTRVLYITLSNGNNNIWVIGANSGSPSLLFGQHGWKGYPSMSPDGTRIVFASDWQAYDFVYDIYTINADGSNFTYLTGSNFDSFDYLSPRWAPSGTKLALAIVERTGIDQYNTQIGTMNPDGTALTPLISGAAVWTKTAWSSDGTKILYTKLVGTRKDVAWVSVNGSASGTIVTNGWNADWQH